MSGATPVQNEAIRAKPRVRFQAGGALGEGALYVERAADRELPEALRRGELCYVLATRQIGKSSLRLRTTRRLVAEGIACVTIDLTALGTENTSAETWYVGLTAEIALGLDLPPPDDCWEKHKALGPVHAFSRYMEDEVLAGVGGRVVIFIDEIDATLSLPFARDDFFAAVRAFYIRRADRPENQRLTFCLLGVAAPGDLISDPTRTPFNIGRAVHLEDFSRSEVGALAEGLGGSEEERTGLLDEVFGWTSGHPYMTQRICDLLVKDGDKEDTEKRSVDDVVRATFLERGRTEDSNLQYAERWFDEARLRKVGSQVPRMLRLYRQILSGEEVVANGADPVQLGLRLTGLAAERRAGDGPRRLDVRSRIFGTVFDGGWVRTKEASRVIAEPLARWMESQRRGDFLIGGDALRQAQAWAKGRDDLNADEQAFLQASERRGQELIRSEERRRAQRTLVVVLVAMVTLLAGALGLAVWQTVTARQAQQDAEVNARKAREQSERAELESKRSNARRLAALAEVAGISYPQRRLLLGVESTIAARGGGTSVIPVAAQALGDGVRATPGHRVLAGHTGPLVAAVFSLDGERVLTASYDKTARFWNADGSGEPIVLRGHEQWITTTVFSPDGSRVVTASGYGTPRIWSTDGFGQPLILRGHEDVVWSAVFSPDGKRVLTASRDNTARLWNIDGSGQPHIFRGHEATVQSAVFSPDGKHVLTASEDKTARVWNVDGAGEPLILRGHEAMVRSAVFSPDGKRVLTGSYDKTARHWNVDGSGQSLVFRGHEGPVYSAVFSPDGKRVLTASYDKTARLWNADSSGEPIVLRGHEDTVYSAIFSPDGKRVFTGSEDKTARLWTIDVDLLVQKACQYAGRNLTRIEWAQFMPDEPYRKTCPEWPEAPEPATP